MAKGLLDQTIRPLALIDGSCSLSFVWAVSICLSKAAPWSRSLAPATAYCHPWVSQTSATKCHLDSRHWDLRFEPGRSHWSSLRDICILNFASDVVFDTRSSAMPFRALTPTLSWSLHTLFNLHRPLPFHLNFSSFAPPQVQKPTTIDNSDGFLPWLERKAGSKISSSLSIGNSSYGRYSDFSLFWFHWILKQCSLWI